MSDPINPNETAIEDLMDLARKNAVRGASAIGAIGGSWPPPPRPAIKPLAIIDELRRRRVEAGAKLFRLKQEIAETQSEFDQCGVAIDALMPTTSGPSPETARAFDLPADEGEYYANVRDRIVGDEAEQQASVDMAAAVERAKQAGAKAREAGEDSTACPYPQDSLEATAWTGGWIEGDGAMEKTIDGAGMTLVAEFEQEVVRLDVADGQVVATLADGSTRDITDHVRNAALEHIEPQASEGVDQSEATIKAAMDDLAYKLVGDLALSEDTAGVQTYVDGDQLVMREISASELYAPAAEGEIIIGEPFPMTEKQIAQSDAICAATDPQPVVDPTAKFWGEGLMRAAEPKRERAYWPFGGKLVGGA